MHFRTSASSVNSSRGVLLAETSDVDCVLSLGVDTRREHRGRAFSYQGDKLNSEYVFYFLV